MTTENSPKNLGISVLEYAEMCRDVYESEKTPPNHCLFENGWEREPLGYEDGVFRARLYKRDQTRVLAYRGSTSHRHNWVLGNAPHVLKIPSVYHDFAEKAYEKACKLAPRPVALTGHSLGGYLAQYVSVFVRVQKHNPPNGAVLPCAIAFNPNHVGDLRTKLRIGEFKETVYTRHPMVSIQGQPVGTVARKLNFIIDPGNGDVYPYIVTYRTRDDVVSRVGEKVGYEHTFSSRSPVTTGVLRDLMSMGPLLATGKYFYDVHKMDTVVEHLWADAALGKKEVVGLVLLPKDALAYHSHDAKEILARANLEMEAKQRQLAGMMNEHISRHGLKSW